MENNNNKIFSPGELVRVPYNGRWPIGLVLGKAADLEMFKAKSRMWFSPSEVWAVLIEGDEIKPYMAEYIMKLEDYDNYFKDGDKNED